jgi:hypothetical protein
MPARQGHSPKRPRSNPEVAAWLFSADMNFR